MSGGGDGFGGAVSGSKAAVVMTEGALTVHQALGGHTQGGIGPVIGAFGASAEDITAGDILVRPPQTAPLPRS